MSDIFNTATAIGKLGLLGFALLVLVAVMTAWLRGWLVPAMFYQREIDRANKLEATNEKLADSLDVVTGIIEKRGDGR